MFDNGIPFTRKTHILTLNVDHSPHAHSRDVFLCYKCLYRGQFYAESAEAKTE